LFQGVRRLDDGPLVGWMYHGNLAASLLGACLRRPVIWNVRHSVARLADEPFLLRQLIGASARLSVQPLRIVYNARAAAAQHEALGFRADRRVVLPNGFDTGALSPDPTAPARLRRDLGLGRDAVLVGAIGRYHPMKDHAGLLRAVSRLADRHPGLHLVLVGRGLDGENGELAAAVREAKLAGRVHCLGERGDVESVVAGLDLLASASAWGEGFPNVVAEAMACEVPAVVTDVGDSAYVVGNTGRVVPPRDPAALSGAIGELLSLPAADRAALGTRARARVADNFDIHKVARRYAGTWDPACEAGAPEGEPARP
jgi:glycosyltransferase involved in cell wall biosynthesis